MIIGPFAQLITMEGLNLRGAINDDQLRIITNAGIQVEAGMIKAIGSWDTMAKTSADIYELKEDYVGLPGFIDSHTHICFGGSRHKDYSARNAGLSYLEIASAGGGIWDTVQRTREADFDTLYHSAQHRIQKLLSNGITTVEVKSGYGLSIQQELKQLQVIDELKRNMPISIVPTCLAAHMKPRDYDLSNSDYLALISKELLPILKQQKLTNRVDIFVEEGAFSVDESRVYLRDAQRQGFDITVHGDQFSTGGSTLAIELEAASVDHLEASDQDAILALGNCDVVATVLPGASLGLGIPYASARLLLDAGAIVSIASDWNPGSAPMGNLLAQASLLGAAEKLTNAEVFAGLTSRAARALRIKDRGVLQPGTKADFIAFPANDYREILYHQGELKPTKVWKNGELYGQAV